MTIELTDAERRKFERLAHAHGLSNAEYLLGLVTAAMVAVPRVRSIGLPDDPPLATPDRLMVVMDVLRDLIASNHHQLAGGEAWARIALERLYGAQRG